MMPSRKRMMSAALLAVLAVGLSGCPDDEVNNVVTLDGSAVDTSTFPDGTSGDAAGGDAVDSDVPSIDVGADVPTIDVGADTPQADAPQADAPQADAPQADAPQADAPQADAPQADAPTSDIPVGDDASGDGSSGDGASGDEGTDVSPLGNIIEVATEAGNFTTLLAALDAAGLTSTFEGTDEYTVLAPTDDAFTAALATLGIDAPTLLADPGLADILTYHVLAGSVPASVVVTLTEATTLNGADVTITVDSDGNVFINDTVQVTVTDIPASNGIIHVLDGVLLPPEPPLGNIIEVATAAGNFTTLLAALDAAGLTSTFEGTDEYTVLAPTDNAFTAALATLGIDAPTLLADPGLADILTYHVLAGSVPASVVVTLTEATTLNGADITITVDGNGNVFINDTVQVTVTDIPASNGIIHVLDGVLLPPEPPLGNIIEVATAAGNFTTLLAALDAAGLTSTFEGTDEYTVLAPTDDAFTAALATLGIDAPTLLADPGLADILTYHVLAGSVPASVVVTLPDATTLNGADITITVDGNGNVFINDTVQVTVTDIPASNGIIHVLDGVLLPPEPPLGNIIEVATAAGNFTTLLAALDAAGLTSTFEGTDEYTVLAPTDDAFTALLATLGIDAPTLFADPGLADILTYHVLAGSVPASVVVTLTEATTLNGSDITITVDGNGNVFINDTVQVTVTDIPASNGIIHVLDGVLTPPAPPLGNIIEVATAAGNFTTLLAALDAAGLTSTFEGTEEYTVLAPTDDAFTALLATLGIDAPTLLADPGLADILTYHVLDGSVPASVVVTLPDATTLNGADITITVDGNGNVFINDTVQVTVTDIPASNGIIHVLDGVLLPPTDPPLGNIIEVATAAGNFTTLLAALDAAGLTSTFEGTDLYTVFAPTDDAFTALLATLGIDAPTLLADPGLADILLYHVISGASSSTDIAGEVGADTLNGVVSFNVLTDGTIVINGSVSITVTDVPASNGVIHIIDAVLLPTDLPDDGCCNANGTTACSASNTACYDAVVALDDFCASNFDAACNACAQLGVGFQGLDCSAAVDVCGCQELPLGNIIEVATAAGNFTTLLAALDAAGLTSTFEGTDEYTVLAPTDDAFAALLATLGIDAPTLLADPGLTDILTYHVLAGSVPASVVVTLTEATTLNGADITITVDGNGNVFINDSVQVTVTDIPASNGIIHVLDGVLSPPPPPPLGNIIEVATAAGNFTTLLAALDAAGLTSTFEGTDQYTVLAPTDDAFAALLATLGIDAPTLLADPGLADILLYHVISGASSSTDIAGEVGADTLNGVISLNVLTDGTIVINDSVSITVTDVPASNGVIHVIDAVLLPSALPEDGCCNVNGTSACSASNSACFDAVVALDDFCASNFDEACNACAQQGVGFGGIDCSAAVDVCGCQEPILGNIIEVATAAGNFTTLLAALDATGLTSTFEGTDEYTVLAPTDDAFTALLATLGIDAPTLLADPGLADILTYHVLAGSVPAAVVVTLTEATTLNGADITITVDGNGDVFINDTVQVTVTDIPASNGIIHVLDGVLLPPDPDACCSVDTAGSCQQVAPSCYDAVVAADPVCANTYDEFCVSCAVDGTSPFADCSGVPAVCGCP